jgi:nucleotide-binding universal stress UspA family protein
MRVSTYDNVRRPDGEREEGHADRRWRVLVAVDGTASGARALKWSLDLAEQVNARLTAVVIQGRLPAYPATVAEVDAELARRQERFDPIGVAVLDEGTERGVEIDVQFRHGVRSRVLRREAAANRYQLIVVGRASPLRWLLGAGTPSSLARTLSCPVVVVN